MNKLFKIKLLMILCMINVLLMACRNENSRSESKSTETVYYEYMSCAGYTDSGIVSQNGNGFLEYFDTNTGESVVICSKPNCKHEIMSSDEETDCYGYVNGIAAGMAIYSNNLYFLYEPDYGNGDYAYFGTQIFCKADKDGSSRKTIANLTNMQYIGVAGYYENYFVVGYYNQYDEDGNELEKREVGVAVIDIDNGDVIYIPTKDVYDGIIDGIYLEDGIVTYAYDECTEYIDYLNLDMEWDEYEEYLSKIIVYKAYQYDIKTGEETMIWSSNGVDLCKAVGQGWMCVEDDGVRMINLTTLEENELGSEYSDMDFYFDNDKVIIADYNDETGIYSYLYYVFNNGTVAEIGTCTEEYNFSVIALTDSFVYIYYYDSDGEPLEGYITKEDFYEGRLESVVYLKNVNIDSAE